MPEITLSAGTIEYDDTGGPGPVVVLLHGVLTDASLWRFVAADLERDHRCVLPTLPLGSHATPMGAEADLSLRGVAMLVGEFLATLDLQDVTLVGNDTGGALVQLLVAEQPDRVDRIVLASCEAFENYPPGLPGKTSAVIARLPGGLWLAAQQMRLAPLRRLPLTFGWLAKRAVPADIVDRWMHPIRTRPAIRRDFKRLARSGDPRADLMQAAGKLPTFDRPALVVWAAEDRVMPVEHGRRLASLLPQGRFVEIDDSYTFIPLDQPAELADAVRGFVART